MKVLVTGSNGFVGPYLIAELQAAGHTAYALDRSGEPPSGIPESRYFNADLSDTDDIEAAFAKSGCDAVAHLAGWSHVGESWKRPEEVFRINVSLTLALFRIAARQMGPNGRFLFISSADVYGVLPPEQLPLTEDSLIDPDSPYALSKFCAERALRLMRSSERCELCIARPFNHIGAGQAENFVAPSFARQVAEVASGSRDCVRHGNLTARRDFLDVRDVVRAYRLILERGLDGEVYNICSGESHSIDWVLRELFRIAGIDAKMELDPKRLRPVDRKELRGSAEHLQLRTGWKRKYTLRETLESIYEEAAAKLRLSA